MELKDRFKITTIDNIVVDIEYIFTDDELNGDDQYYDELIFNSDTTIDFNIKTSKNQKDLNILNIDSYKELIKSNLIKYINTGDICYFKQIFRGNDGNELFLIFKNGKKFTFYNYDFNYNLQNLHNFVKDINKSEQMYVLLLKCNLDD